jgi:hypothetical protein
LELRERLREYGYLADKGLSTAIFLALKLGRPLFLEGGSLRALCTESGSARLLDSGQ